MSKSLHPLTQRQRDGWELAAGCYDAQWQAPLAPAQEKLLEWASPKSGERVLDVACGMGPVTLAAALRVAERGTVLGIDISDRMLEAARRRAEDGLVTNVRFERMDAERLDLADESFDLALCSMGVMYATDPVRALREMRRVLRPGGRLAVSAWGEPSRCGLDAAFPAIRDELDSDRLPPYRGLGRGDDLAGACIDAGFGSVEARRIPAQLRFADDDAACEAVFLGGSLALAWSGLDTLARLRARHRFLEAIASWKHGRGYRIPAEFVIVTARPIG